MGIPIIKGKEFEICPEYLGRGVCVDVTPLKEYDFKGEKVQQFQIVFEVETLKTDGNRFAVWSKPMKPSCHPDSSFSKFITKWWGRTPTEEEWTTMDTESFLGKPARLVVIPETKGEHTFAVITSCTPHKTGDPLQPSGKFVRKQDREETMGKYKKTGPSAPAPSSPKEPASAAELEEEPVADNMKWTLCKIHVGKQTGHELRELSPDAVDALIVHWMPTAKAKPKMTADDTRLVEALNAYSAWKAASAEAVDPADNEVPY